ncbi:uncharacterized protein EV420DRAFT_861849 [Desarmillaria tabescens]|uniref:Uncharacterized protein n=1 Tax=Armillaria tabescens TaxID=1929756 RepID=A0AA39JS98_ARMTA|nr:uncharacterized protein EV420DRAFT_861849 [Desarmillaria tabescens]KAK0447839.1 hypothetical protein EV420DRAFT_861849 [Desarmillaria tabescens]
MGSSNPVTVYDKKELKIKLVTPGDFLYQRPQKEGRRQFRGNSKKPTVDVERTVDGELNTQGQAFNQPCHKCEEAGVRGEAQALDSPLHDLEAGGRREILCPRCKHCVASETFPCNASMHCWNEAGPAHGKDGTRQHGNEEIDMNTLEVLHVGDVASSLGKRKRTDPASDPEQEDEDIQPITTALQSLQYSILDFVQQLQSPITSLEQPETVESRNTLLKQENFLLKQENACLVQAVVDLRAGRSALQAYREPAAQEANLENSSRKEEVAKNKDNDTHHKKKRRRVDAVSNTLHGKGLGHLKQNDK